MKSYPGILFFALAVGAACLQAPAPDWKIAPSFKPI